MLLPGESLQNFVGMILKPTHGGREVGIHQNFGIESYGKGSVPFTADVKIPKIASTLEGICKRARNRGLLQDQRPQEHLELGGKLHTNLIPEINHIPSGGAVIYTHENHEYLDCSQNYPISNCL